MNDRLHENEGTFQPNPSSDDPERERHLTFKTVQGEGRAAKVAGFQLVRAKFMEGRAAGQENFPDDFSLSLVPIFFVMWRAKNGERRGRGES